MGKQASTSHRDWERSEGQNDAASNARRDRPSATAENSCNDGEWSDTADGSTRAAGRPRSRPPHAGQAGQAMQRPTGCPGAPPTLTAKAASHNHQTESPPPRRREWHADRQPTRPHDRPARWGKLRVPQTRASAAIRERGTKYGCPTETREGGRGGRPPLAGAPRAGRCRSRRDCGAGRRAGPAWPCVLGRLTLLYCPARRRKGGSRQTATVQWCAAVLLQLSNGMHPHDSLSWGFDPDCEPDTRLASQSGASKSPAHTVQ